MSSATGTGYTPWRYSAIYPVEVRNQSDNFSPARVPASNYRRALGLDPTLTVTDWVSKLISNPIAQGRILKNPLAAGFPE